MEFTDLNDLHKKLMVKIKLGDTKQQVIKKFGEPTNINNFGRYQILYYLFYDNDIFITIEDGLIIKLLFDNIECEEIGLGSLGKDNYRNEKYIH